MAKSEEKIKKDTFLKGVKKEMKKVSWPSAKDVVKYSLATIGLAVFLVLFFMLLNIITSFIKGLFV